MWSRRRSTQCRVSSIPSPMSRAKMRRERASLLGIVLIADKPHIVADLLCLFFDPVQKLRVGISHLARSDLAQRRDNGLVVPVVHQRLRSLEKLAGPLP